MADDVYNATSLRSKAPSFNLNGDSDPPGFILLSIQGRNLSYPTAAPRDGHHHDFYFRDLRTPSRNPDIALVDHLIDSWVKSGLADPNRIYLMGWSNGGFFSEMYGMARHRHSTPEGHHVAAVAIFSAADPFANIREGLKPSCELEPYPVSDLPILILSRSCDLVACSEAQAQGWGLSTPLNPGQVVSDWMEDLQTRIRDPFARWIIISGMGPTVRRCTPSWLCGLGTAAVNHLRWPDGVADGSGIDHEIEMLDFLRDHPWVAAPAHEIQGRAHEP